MAWADRHRLLRGARPGHIFAALAGLVLLASLSSTAAAVPSAPATGDLSDFEAKLTAADEELYTRAFRAADGGGWNRANRLARRAREPLPAKILEWLRLTRGQGEPSFERLVRFIEQNPNWPRRRSLLAQAEEAMAKNVSDARIIAWFRARRPVTGRGRQRLGEALLAEGFAKQGAEWLRHTWVHDDYEREEQRRFHKWHRSLLRTEDHVARLDRLLWDERRSDAKAILGLVPADQRRLAEARLALMRRSRDVGKRISAVPSALRNNPGLVYERVRWRRRAGEEESARKLLAAHEGDEGARPEKWWAERHRHVRDLIEKRRMKTAYALAQMHGQPPFSVGFAEAEFLSGWLALRFLKKPLAAAWHFRRLYDGVRFPISRARAAYRRARASQALGQANHAQRWYRLAARYPATYYGQLATEALGRGSLLRLPRLRKPRDAERRIFARRELVRAAAMMSQLGQRRLFRSFMLRLGETLPGRLDQYLLSWMARRHRHPGLAIRLAKKALRQGTTVIETAYPLVTIPRTRSERSLVLAVARQESEFDPRAISPAGARGIMQLMPSTARGVSRDIGARYSKRRLTGDPRYNIRLGDSYLVQLAE